MDPTCPLAERLQAAVRTCGVNRFLQSIHNALDHLQLNAAINNAVDCASVATLGSVRHSRLMSDEMWILGVRAAGVFHFITVALAHFTPIPPGWDDNLARLPTVHRRFALAQNAFIGVAMIFAGAVSLFFARELVTGTVTARIICAGIALWWGGRLVVLPWLGVWPELRTGLLRVGFAVLHVECAVFALAYGWLALVGA